MNLHNPKACTRAKSLPQLLEPLANTLTGGRGKLSVSLLDEVVIRPVERAW